VKAFLLAAGHGERLRPITDSVPKCLVPIRGVPMLSIWLQACERIGIDEVLINLHAHADVVCDFLRTAEFKTRVKVVVEPQLLGSAGTLRANREWVEADEFFWVFYADVLNCADLEGMLAMHRSHEMAATLGVYEVAEPKRCGIVTADADGVIRDFVEKPQNPTSNLAFSGLMIATTEVLDAIPPTTPVDIGFHVLPQLVGRMQAYPIKDYLIDVGTLATYQLAQQTWPGAEGLNQTK
jgi:mannose-1-phosphate guanylyltransferase